MGGKLLFRDFRTRLGKAMAAEAAKAEAQNKQNASHGKKTSPDRAIWKQNGAKHPASAEIISSKARSGAQKSPQSKEVMPVRKSPPSVPMATPIPIVTIAPEEKENIQPDSSSSLIRVEMAESTTRDSPKSGSPGRSPIHGSQEQCESPMTGSPSNSESPKGESPCNGGNASPLNPGVSSHGEMEIPSHENSTYTNGRLDSDSSRGHVDSIPKSMPRDSPVLNHEHEQTQNMLDNGGNSGYVNGERPDSPILDVTTVDEDEPSISAPVTVQA